MNYTPQELNSALRYVDATGKLARTPLFTAIVVGIYFMGAFRDARA